MQAQLKILATVRSHRELMAVLRARAEEKHITREMADHESGMQSGYAGKLLSPVPTKNFGIVSLGAILGVLKLKILVVADE